MNDTATVLAQRDRLAAIAEIDLDAPELRRRLDELAARTAGALGLPIGLVSIVVDSAQMLAGSSGVTGWIAEAGGTPVEWSFCANAVVRRAPYVVQDAANDELQHDNPLVTVDGFASYAGAPLLAPGGHVLGAQCVLGLEPRAFGPEDVRLLETSAAEAVAILEEYRTAA